MTTLKKLNEHLESTKELREQKNAEYTKVCNDEHKELEVIRQKYKSGIDTLKTIVDDFDNDIRDTENKIREEEIDQVWLEAQSKNELSEFYFLSMMNKCGLDTYGSIDIKHKKTLKNGIDIWMIIDDNYRAYKLYLAFSGQELVGTSYRETPKHAGDATLPFSFIGDFKQVLTGLKTRRGYINEREMNLTFQEWAKELKKIDVDTFDAVPMNDATLKEIKEGVKKYWCPFSWERRGEK